MLYRGFNIDLFKVPLPCPAMYFKLFPPKLAIFFVQAPSISARYAPPMTRSILRRTGTCIPDAQTAQIISPITSSGIPHDLSYLGVSLHANSSRCRDPYGMREETSSIQLRRNTNFQRGTFLNGTSYPRTFFYENGKLLTTLFLPLNSQQYEFPRIRGQRDMTLHHSPISVCSTWTESNFWHESPQKQR